MSDCRFGVSSVNYPDPDPEQLTGSVNNKAFIKRTSRVIISLTRKQYSSIDNENDTKGLSVSSCNSSMKMSPINKSHNP